MGRQVRVGAGDSDLEQVVDIWSTIKTRALCL